MSKTQEGLNLVSFFLAVQQVVVAAEQNHDDWGVMMSEIRDRYFDHGSSRCLPSAVFDGIAETSNR